MLSYLLDKQDAVGVSIGNEIHLAKGEFGQGSGEVSKRSRTAEAMGLLAHELTHFVQKEQDRVSADAIFKGQAVNTDPQLEQEADLVAEKFLARAPLPTLATEKAKNPTDEVAQLKPKKPFAEWVLLDEQNNYQLYELEDEYIICNMQTLAFWYIPKFQFKGYFSEIDIASGWQMLTPTEINELQIPLNNLPRKPKTKVPPTPPVTNPKQEEQKKSPFVWGNGATTPTTSELPSNLYADLHLYTDKKSLTKREQDRTISWNDFISEVISLENSLTPEKRQDTRFVITQFRKLYYNTGHWNTMVVPNTAHIEQEVQSPNLTNHPNVELLNGNIVDFGHIFAGLDAGNHDIGEGVGMAWLGVSNNIDMATWIGDLASITAEGYFKPNDIQRLIDENCSPQDLLADIDAVGVDFLHKKEPYSLVSDLLQAHYGEKPKYTQRDRILAFAQATQLGTFDGANFSAENTWLAQYKSEMSDAVTLLVGKQSGYIGKFVASINFWNETYSETTAEYFLIKLLNLIKKYV